MFRRSGQSLTTVGWNKVKENGFVLSFAGRNIFKNQDTHFQENQNV